ncbi:PAS domain-containing protein [Lichenihabitans psoromatis]|uniref:PAS domain-containing protein n=1 Tax=Lichenihabitans psoromatis TaxID=2528642 RepID=UPI0013F15CC6|nr:PAS domain-containing protein [Lichenihabitans psoromatis]
MVAAETTRMPMVFSNAKGSDHPIIFVNQAFLTLTAFDENELLGKPFESLLEPGTDPEALTEIGTAFAGGRGLETQVRCRCKDHGPVWVTVFVTAVRDRDGRTVQHFASFVDISRDKEVESRLRIHLEQLEYRGEMMLASVKAIAVQLLQSAVGQQGVEDFERRVQALKVASQPDCVEPRVA